MRSEERAGIVAAVLLLLWGTVLTYPIHIFTVFLERIVSTACGILPESMPAVVRAILVIAFLVGIEIMLLLISKTKFACFIPVTALALTSASFVLRSIQTRSFDAKTGAALAVVLVLTALFHLLKAEKVLLWEGDFFILAISAHLFTGLVAAPLVRYYDVMGKILYIDHFKDTFLAQPFEGFLTLPSFVWGLFFLILLSLPVVYYTFSRKKA